ncbi:MAG TPA: tRNA lysidine(34) synthetase TilS, partial [Fimbriimonas sp.]
FLNQAAFRTESSQIATAHTMGDLVETVLFNLARGTGLRGISGIPERRGNLVRPMLPFTREETRGYCDDRALWYHDDPSNTDLSFARARIRHNVIPNLRQVNEAFELNVVRLAGIAREEDGFLDGMAAAALEQSEKPLNADLAFLTEDVEVAFSTARLGSLPAPLLKRAMRLACEALGAGLDHHATTQLVERLAVEPKGSLTAEGGRVVVEWDADAIHLRDLIPTVPFRYTLTVPGETASDEFGWRFVAYDDPAPGKPMRKSLEAWLDRSKVRGQLFFRTFKEGDEIQPLGFDGHRKLSDLLAEAKLTVAARQRLPIVCDMLGPVWAPGVCLSGRAAAGEGSANAIAVRFESLRTERRS